LFLQLRGPATFLNRKFLYDLTTAQHAKIFFCNMHNLFTMKTEKFQVRGSNSVCAEAFQLLRGRAPAQLRRDTCAVFCKIIDD
jgi:hypothetical protein